MNGSPATTVCTLSARARVLALCLAALLAVPMLSGLLATDHRARAKWEKRDLNPTPQWSGVGQSADWFGALSSHLDDHVGLALPVNRFYRKLLFYLFHDDPVPEVTRGHNGYSYLNSYFSDRPLDIFRATCERGVRTAELPQLESRLRRIFEFYERQGLRVTMAIAPSKPVLYPEHLPHRVPAELRSACARYQQQPNIPTLISSGPLAVERVILYPFDSFLAARNDPSFYPPQNFHWTGASAHLMAKQLLTALDLAPGPGFSAGSALGTSHSDLAMKGFREAITVWKYPYADYGVRAAKHRGKWARRFFPRKQDYRRYQTSNPVDPQRRALLISNSFGAFLAPHLAPGFASLVNLNINQLSQADYRAVVVDYVARGNFTDLIFVLHDLSLITGYKFGLMERALTADAASSL
jgi:hypothetical protein